MQHAWFSNIRDDAIGGLVSAAVAIPLAMGFGIFAFAVLGDSQLASAALIGLYAAAIVGVVSIVLGAGTTTVYAPGINSAFFLGILLYNIVNSDFAFLKVGGLPLMLAMLFLVVLLAGALQALFGAIRLGTLIKYAPHPVLAGFQNTAAVLLFLMQIGSVIGVERSEAFVEVLKSVEQAKPLSILVAAVTVLGMWQARKSLPAVPAVIIGLIAGTAVYHGLAAAGFAEQLGSVIGPATGAAILLPDIPDFAALLHTPEFMSLVPTIIGAALGLAIIASIDALLGSKLVAQPGDMKTAGDWTLLRLGLGNAAAGALGSITSSPNVAASNVNRAFGARTPLSVLVHCAAIFAVAAVAFPVLAHLPRAVLSAVLMVIAFQHIDRWTLRHMSKLASGARHFRRYVTLELLVMIVVAVLSITVSIVLAVFVGVAIAVVLFMLRMSRSVIRRSYRCNDVQSRKSRTSAETYTLEAEGSSILVMELNGVLFFGSAETLANEIDAAMAQDTRYVILDLRRVTDIDNTGSQILMEIHGDLAPQGKHLIFALAANSETAAQLADFGVLEAVGADMVFPDVDRAIEWAEDDLLADKSREGAATQELPLDRVSMLAGLADDDIAAIGSHLSRATYSPGSAVFREGDPGTDMFIVVKGTASAYIQQNGGGDIRLVTFAPGTVFGELAILDKGVRSATVVADNELVCHVLSGTSFAALSAQSPAVAIKLLANLGRELSGRLRLANQTIHQLQV